MTAGRIISLYIIFVSFLFMMIGTLAVGETAPTANLVIQSVDTSKYPVIDLQVLLPAEMVSDQPPSAENFKLAENGKNLPLAVETIPISREPIAVVLAIDTSGSMRGKPLLDAKKAAKDFVKVTKETDEIAIVSFSSKASVAAGFTADKSELAGAIDGLEASGETALYDALVTAVNLSKNSARGQKNIVLLSDGGDTQSINKLDTAMNSLKGSAIPAYVVALSSPESDPKTLELIARESNGRLMPVADSAKLSQLFTEIAREIQTRFEITFESAEPNTADIEIAVNAVIGDSEATANTLLKNPAFRRLADSPQQEDSGRGSPYSPTVWLMITTLLSFAAAGLLTLGVIRIFRPDPSTIKQLEFFERISKPDSAQPEPDKESMIKTKMMGAIGAAADKRGVTPFVQARLEKAGLPIRALEYMFFHILIVIAAGLIIGLITRRFTLSVVIIILATVIPMMVVQHLINRREAAFQQQLPDVLNFIASSLRAGHGLLQAISLLEHETTPPVSTEFRRVQTEAQLGLPLEEALAHMAERLGSDDFRWAVAAITIQRDAGGNLAEVLDIVAKTVRERETLRRQISTLSAEGRLSAIILIVLPFAQAILLFLANPLYMSQLFTATFGIVLIVLAFILVLVGAIWLRRIVMIEV